MLDNYNELNAAMHLVLFEDAMQHVWVGPCDPMHKVDTTGHLMLCGPELDLVSYTCQTDRAKLQALFSPDLIMITKFFNYNLWYEYLKLIKYSIPKIILLLFFLKYFLLIWGTVISYTVTGRISCVLLLDTTTSTMVSETLIHSLLL